MVISDLSYLEVVSEEPSIVGGKKTRVNIIKVDQTAILIGGGSIIQSISIVSSNDNLQL